MHGNFSMAYKWLSAQRQRQKEKERKNRSMIYQVIVVFVYDGLAGPAITSHFAIAPVRVCLFIFTYIVRGIYYIVHPYTFNIWIVSHTHTNGDCDAFLNYILSSIAFLCPFSHHRSRRWRWRWLFRLLQIQSNSRIIISLNSDHHDLVEPNAGSYVCICRCALGIDRRSRNVFITKKKRKQIEERP